MHCFVSTIVVVDCVCLVAHAVVSAFSKHLISWWRSNLPVCGVECFQPLWLIADNKKMIVHDDFGARFAGDVAQLVIWHNTDIQNNAVARQQEKSLLCFPMTDDGDRGTDQLLWRRKLTHNTIKSRWINAMSHHRWRSVNQIGYVQKTHYLAWYCLVTNVEFSPIIPNMVLLACHWLIGRMCLENVALVGPLVFSMVLCEAC